MGNPRAGADGNLGLPLFSHLFCSIWSSCSYPKWFLWLQSRNQASVLHGLDFLSSLYSGLPAQVTSLCEVIPCHLMIRVWPNPHRFLDFWVSSRLLWQGQVSGTGSTRYFVSRAFLFLQHSCSTTASPTESLRSYMHRFQTGKVRKLTWKLESVPGISSDSGPVHAGAGLGEASESRTL